MIADVVVLSVVAVLAFGACVLSVYLLSQVVHLGTQVGEFDQRGDVVTLRGDLDRIKAEVLLDTRKSLVDDHHRVEDIAEAELQRTRVVLGGSGAVLHGRDDVDASIKPLSNAHAAEPTDESS